jgi:hypothetical protein
LSSKRNDMLPRGGKRAQSGRICSASAAVSTSEGGNALEPASAVEGGVTAAGMRVGRAKTQVVQHTAEKSTAMQHICGARGVAALRAAGEGSLRCGKGSFAGLAQPAGVTLQGPGDGLSQQGGIIKHAKHFGQITTSVKCIAAA